MQPLAATGSHGHRFDKLGVVTDGGRAGHLFWLRTTLTLEWKRHKHFIFGGNKRSFSVLTPFLDYLIGRYLYFK